MRQSSPLCLLAAGLAMLLASCSRPQERVSPAAAAKRTRAIKPPATHPKWGYEPDDGPPVWGKLSQDWRSCAEGSRQSPIDIRSTTPTPFAALAVRFRPAELKIVHHEHMADIVNTGHSIQVNYTEGDSLTLGGEQFQLLQYHFHGPSEHTIAGEHFPMEMHLVHQSAGGHLAVIGVLIAEGSENPAFSPVLANLPNSRGEEHHLEHVKVDVNQMLPSTTTSYRYSGSLTTPPCSEQVRWIVMTTPVQMSAGQIANFRRLLNNNNRPVQPLNGRLVATDNIGLKE